jgi:hypothetical protein
VDVQSAQSCTQVRDAGGTGGLPRSSRRSLASVQHRPAVPRPAVSLVCGASRPGHLLRSCARIQADQGQSAESSSEVVDLHVAPCRPQRHDAKPPHTLFVFTARLSDHQKTTRGVSSIETIVVNPKMCMCVFVCVCYRLAVTTRQLLRSLRLTCSPAAFRRPSQTSLCVPSPSRTRSEHAG